MSRLPSPTTLQHLTDSLRALGEAPAKGRPRRIDDLEQRLVRAVERDLAGLPTPDGYPATTGGGRSGGRTILVDDDHVPVTSVEGAVIDRDDRRRTRDRHHELAVKAVTAVDAAVVHLQTAFAALASIDDLVNTAPPAPKTCDHCTDKRGPGGNLEVYVRGTVGDRLERALSLCGPCYEFVRQVALPASRNGYLPTDLQILEHDRTGRWRIRVVDGRRKAS